MVQSKDRSLSNSDSKEEAMHLQIAEDRITRFVENKFRVSRSYPTVTTYRHTVHRFYKFLKTKYNLDISELLIQIKEKKSRDPLEVLDDYYTYLSHYKRGRKRPPGPRASISARLLRIRSKRLSLNRRVLAGAAGLQLASGNHLCESVDHRLVPASVQRGHAKPC